MRGSRDPRIHAPLDRRQVLKAMSLAPAAFGLSSLACAGDMNDGSNNPSGLDSGAGGALDWASGGTAVMTGSYPDPFSAGLGSVCALTCAATLGPCYASTVTRKDISEGQNGLPVRLAFLIVDEACKPVPGATVDIWHTSAGGLYSGAETSQMCTFGDAAARAGRWFRGVQTADAMGRVDFDSCFPGWYSGRTIHIHFTVRVSDTATVTSQLFFADTLCDSIVASQPLYKDRGARNTTNQNDNVISPSAVGDYLFQTQRMADGAMLAWKTLVVRSSTGSALCSVPGGSAGMGPGGA